VPQPPCSCLASPPRTSRANVAPEAGLAVSAARQAVGETTASGLSSPHNSAFNAQEVRLSHRFHSTLAACALLIATLTWAPMARAQTQAPAPDRCLAFAEVPSLAPRIQQARFLRADLSATEVRITFLGHSTFLIESNKGVRIATDYNDYYRPPFAPEIVTMNRAHDTHYSNNPSPGIKHILRGWNPDGGPAQHDISLQDVRVRNIPTNTRDFQGGTNVYGNSVFVFEIAGLCIAHLGHLHHTLTVQQLAQLGQMDVVLVPVDGSYTMDLDGMIEVLQAIKAPLMIPMHYFSSYTLERFMTRVRGAFDIEESTLPTIVVSRATLPSKQKVLVLPGR
jgi:L-ascorbate metabolism protein UlaG (beta-lactamase superfamily)